jgi:hypothetical protein
MFLCGTKIPKPDWDLIRKEIGNIFDITAQYGCPTEILMRDVRTLAYSPNNAAEWVKIAREESKRENILGIINEAIDLRDETYAKINHPEEGNLKAYYRKTTEDFLKSLDALCEKLGEAIK